MTLVVQEQESASPVMAKVVGMMPVVGRTGRGGE